MSKLLKSMPQTEADLVQDEVTYFEERSSALMNRRSLISKLSLAAGAAGMLGVAGCSSDGTVTIPSPNTTPSVFDVLNFALNLEYLEANFYSYIVTGSGLSAADQGTSPGTVTGGAKVTFTNSYIATLAANLMTEEVQHVEFLRATLIGAGQTPISQPTINLQPASAYAVTNDTTFLAVARQLEGVGVSAYAGAAQYLVSNTAALTYAAQVLDVEAQHSGALRQACIYYPGLTGTSPVTSPAADSMDIPPSATAIFETSPSTGLNPVRTISEVLQIVYATPGQTGQTKGGFFPNGMNGNIYIS